MESLQAILDETAKTDPRAKKLKPRDIIDLTFLEKMEKNGFFDKLRAAR